MKRFRFTFLAICMILTWLGSSDLILQLRNSQPLSLELAELPAGQLPQEWLSLRGGHLDLAQGINMSGTIEIDSFLIPLVLNRGDSQPRVWVETRDPAIVDLLSTYYFKLDDEQQRADFKQKNRDAFFPQKPITGMTADNLIANANRSKLVELLHSMNVKTGEDILFLTEGKEPQQFRGPLFLALALAGIIRFILWNKKPRNTP